MHARSARARETVHTLITHGSVDGRPYGSSGSACMQTNQRWRSSTANRADYRIRKRRRTIEPDVDPRTSVVLILTARDRAPSNALPSNNATQHSQSVNTYPVYDIQSAILSSDDCDPIAYVAVASR